MITAASVAISTIPHLEKLRSRIRQAYLDRDMQGTELAMEPLPYALTAAARALINVAEAQVSAVASVRIRTNRDNLSGIRIYQLENSEYYPISFALDTYLEAARRTQNAVHAYLSKVLRLSVPMSLADLVGNLRKKRLQLPERIALLVEWYWTHSGETLRAYRDLSQHHAVVSSDGRVTLLPSGQPLIYIVLPNNPHERDLSKLSYLDPRVDALPYIVDSYFQLYAFVFQLTHLLLSYTAGPEMQRVVVSLLKGALRMGPALDGQPVFSPPDIVSRLLGHANELGKGLDAELPRSEIVPTLIVEDQEKTG